MYCIYKPILNCVPYRFSSRNIKVIKVPLLQTKQFWVSEEITFDGKVIQSNLRSLITPILNSHEKRFFWAKSFLDDLLSEFISAENMKGQLKRCHGDISFFVYFKKRFNPYEVRRLWTIPNAENSQHIHTHFGIMHHYCQICCLKHVFP